MRFPKSVIARSEQYRRYVASHACFNCGIEGVSQAAHANMNKGMAMKVCDSRLFPLCGPHWGVPGCHWQFDLCVDMDREQRRELEENYVARMQDIAANDGWVFDGDRIRKAA